MQFQPSFSSSFNLNAIHPFPSQRRKDFPHLDLLDHIHAHGTHLAAFPQPLQADIDFPALLGREDEDVFLLIHVAKGSAEDVQIIESAGLRHVSTDVSGTQKVGELTSTSLMLHAFTSHSRWGTPLTSSSMNNPSVVIRNISPSVTPPWSRNSMLIGRANPFAN